MSKIKQWMEKAKQEEIERRKKCLTCNSQENLIQLSEELINPDYFCDLGVFYTQKELDAIEEEAEKHIILHPLLNPLLILPNPSLTPLIPKLITLCSNCLAQNYYQCPNCKGYIKKKYLDIDTRREWENEVDLCNQCANEAEEKGK